MWKFPISLKLIEDIPGQLHSGTFRGRRLPSLLPPPSGTGTYYRSYVLCDRSDKR